MSEPAVKFLLVDDLAENLTALEALLRRDGLELYQARSGPEALELLLQHDFALALLDVQMPGMDGFELAELMRGTERTRRVPIVFITAAATDERRKFRGYAAGAVDYMYKPIDPQALRSKTEVFFELAQQRQELARQRDELQESERRLSAALHRLQAHGDNSPLAAIELGPDLRIVSWSKGAERIFGWPESEIVGRQIADIDWGPLEDSDALQDVFRGMVAGRQGRNVHTTRNYCAGGSLIDCEWYNSALFDASGALLSVNAQILDITGRKRAEKTQHLLIGELNHRVKNTLATVQAIATQTLRHSASPQVFATAFSGRIQSLARAHSMLSAATWRGAMLADLIQDQLRLGALDESRLDVSGPEVGLSPQLALHLALILHELVTNANKYGAMSHSAGRIAVFWTVDDARLCLSWVEKGGAAVKAATRRGFGTTLIEQSAKAQGGEAHASYRAEGIAWDIALVLSEDAPPAADVGIGADTVSHSLGAPVAPKPDVLSGARILVVEDEPMVALELVALLEDKGARVVGPAGSLEHALELIAADRYDGALLDANLNGMAVDEAAAALTRLGVPFVFISGYGAESLPRAFASAPHVQKPFTPTQILDVVSTMLGSRGVSVVELRKQN
jgi:PAS domain S-box-containing protein